MRSSPSPRESARHASDAAAAAAAAAAADDMAASAGDDDDDNDDDADAEDTAAIDASSPPPTSTHNDDDDQVQRLLLQGQVDAACDLLKAHTHTLPPPLPPPFLCIAVSISFLPRNAAIYGVRCTCSCEVT